MDIANKWGAQYFWNDAELRAAWDDLQSNK